MVLSDTTNMLPCFREAPKYWHGGAIDADPVLAETNAAQIVRPSVSDKALVTG